jgi:protein-disulfide isomerase
VSKKSVKPQKSRAPFLLAIGVVLVGGAAALYYATRPAEVIAVTVDPNAPPVEATGYLYGNADAPITITEYADFECPGCAQFAVLHTPDIKSRIVASGLANFRFYDFPLAMHPNAMAAHLAAACANEQGKFWEMHDRIFLGQNEWNTLATRNPRKVLEGYASELGLDMGNWNGCYDSQRHVPAIEANRNAGIKVGVGSTPTLQIGNKLYPGGLTSDNVKRIVDSMAAAMGATVSADSAAFPTP